jgi:hypothetical protein
MFTLDQVVPWGRSFGEYRRMFALTEKDLTIRIVGCGDGPASFNAEAARRGTRVVSCDPIYRFEKSEIQKRIEIDLCVQDARDFGHDVSIETVPYGFQRGGNQMLRIRARTSAR